jgi:hypothetical protein
VLTLFDADVFVAIPHEPGPHPNADFVDHILNAIALLGREARDAKRPAHHCFAYRSIHSRLLKTLGTST